MDDLGVFPYFWKHPCLELPILSFLKMFTFHWALLIQTRLSGAHMGHPPSALGPGPDHAAFHLSSRTSQIKTFGRRHFLSCKAWRVSTYHIFFYKKYSLTKSTYMYICVYNLWISILCLFQPFNIARTGTAKCLATCNIARVPPLWNLVVVRRRLLWHVLIVGSEANAR